MKKIAFTGSSGSGKTTLVKEVSKRLGIPHISGSASEVRKKGDSDLLSDMFKFPGGGHAGVIKYSALNAEYAILNQNILQIRRAEIIAQNDFFVTDRSPLDNLTYFISQAGYHPLVTDQMVEDFMGACLDAYKKLTHLIFVKAVQPGAVEQNYSRIANRYYQKSIDAQFEYWLKTFFIPESGGKGPLVLTIDWWDLDLRIAEVVNFVSLDKS